MRECLKSEAAYRTSRSSGPGGQHVNKTESRVELRWDPSASACLDEVSRLRLQRKLGPRLTAHGELILSCGTHRSQHLNRQEVTERFLALVEKCLVTEKVRRPTRPTRSGIENRIRDKKKKGEIKRSRRPPALE